MIFPQFGIVLALVVLWAIVVGKLATYLVEFVDPPRLPAWLETALRLIPSWRLFGQRRGSYDLRLAVIDWVETAPSQRDQHVQERPTRPLSTVLLNSSGRPRAMLRRIARPLIAVYETDGAEAASRTPNAAVLARVGAGEVRLHHPVDAADRAFTVLIILDRGFHAVEPVEAIVEIGPYRVGDVRAGAVA